MRLREHESVKSKYDAFRVDPRLLKVTEGYNVRDFSTPQAIESLNVFKESIREAGGVLVPLEVRMVDDEVHIVSGHRRHRAVMDLIAEGMEIETVPAVVEPKTTNDAERILRLVLHNAGEPLSMLEKAEVVRRLINMGWSREKIAGRLGYKTQQSIANFEFLLAAPEQVREAVRQGDVSPSTAVELVRQHGDGAAAKLTDIKVAAQKRGKSRASIKDIKPTGNADPYVVEQRNKQRIAEHSKETNKSQNDMARLEQAIAAIIDMESRGVGAKAMAEAFGTRRSNEVEIAADWLYTFCDELKQREAA